MAASGHKEQDLKRKRELKASDNLDAWYLSPEKRRRLDKEESGGHCQGAEHVRVLRAGRQGHPEQV